MPHTSSQTFLRELDKKLWTAADRLRSNLDAAVYKHAVLGLIFLKYVSDSFAQRQAEIEEQLRDPESDFHLSPADYGSFAKYEDAIRAELEERDYYIERNVFWVPALARWKTLQDSAKLPAGTVITVKNGKTTEYKITSTGKLIDDALEAVEKENPKLKNVLNKNYTQLQIDPANLAGLIDLIATIPFQHADLHAKDILGHVYEYFLGQFALAEGKKGGQYFTPKSIVSLIVEMIEPYQGRVYDPAMGSGGFFVQSERFIEEHGGTIGDIMVFGQESNPTTWRLAAMNMAIRGIDFDFGKEPADTFTRDQHPDLRADFVMANPPFNIKEWWDGKLEGDARWKYGTPPQGNANFAWVQHMLHHLAPNGSMALLLAKLDINREEIDRLNKDVEEVIEDEEDVSARESTKGKWAELAKLVGAKERVEEIAADLVEHYETRTSVLEGKAMIVAMSRDICVSLFDEIIKLRPEWAGTKLTKDGKGTGWNHEDGAIRIVMTGTASDRPGLQDHVYSKGQKKRLAKRFKDAKDPLKLVIVRDMWLTGFDAPCCHTMYVDKPMAGHNLMQAIARVNRVFAGKEGGLVVDYIGIAAELKNALKTYTDAKGKGAPTLKAEKALDVLLEKLDVLRGLFHGFDYSKYEGTPAEVLALLPAAANHILGLGDKNEINGKKRFLDAMAAANVAYSLCSTLDGAKALKKELAFLSAISAVLRKFDVVDKKRSAEQKHSALKQILDNAVKAEDVQDIFKMAGLERPNIGLLSDAFLEDVRRMEKKNLAVELLERLLQGKIKAQTRTNLVQEKKYSDRLIEALRKYHNRMIESSQVIEEMIQMAKDMQEAMKRHEALGLNPDEEAFYDALADRPEVLLSMGDATLKKLASELTEKLRNSTTVDWQFRDSVRAKMRILIRQLLRKYKYPPEGQEEAIALVLAQAQALADDWTGK